MSKSSLSAMLLQYAVESGEVVVPAVEEITVVTDDTQSTLDEAIEGLAADVEKVEDHTDGAEQVIEAIESLESKVAAFGALMANNVEISPVAAAFWMDGVRDSMESRKIPSALFAADFSSMESSFEAAEKTGDDEAKTEAKKSMLARAKAWIVKMAGMVKAAVMSVITGIKNFVARIGVSATAVVAAGNRLQAVSAALKGEVAGKVKSSGYSMLVVDGKVDANKAIRDINAVWVSDLKSISSKITGAVTLAATALAAKGDVATITAALNKAADALPGEFSKDLPGGAKAVYTVAKTDGILARFSKAKFAVEAGTVEAPAESDALSQADIAALGKFLVSQGESMGINGKNAAESIKTAEGTLAKVEALAKTGVNTEEEVAAVKLALAAAQAVVTMAGKFAPTWGKYTGTMCKKAYAFGMASAAQYKEAKAEKTS